MMTQINIDEYVVNSLTSYGKGINTERQLALVYDGLKPVYRRAIYSALKLTNKGTVKTATIVGDVIGTTHPHGDSSVSDVVSSLVRWGIFTGQGNHGLKMIYGDDIPPSASRYTEACLDDKWRSLFKDLMSYVPYKEAEIEGNTEPEFLPTPIPMILLFSGLGIAFGVNARYPMFTAKSMFNAFIHNDPYLLEGPSGLHINFEKSEIESLWNTGFGKITYEYTIEICNLSSGKGVMITGSPEIFKPNIDKGFMEELAKGQVYVLDQTDSDIPKVFIGRSPNVKSITVEDIYDTVKEITSYTKTFRLTVSDGNSAYIIPLREWLNVTYDNYIELVNKYKQDTIERLKFDHEVYAWLPIITKCLMENRNLTPEELAANNNCDLEIVKAILRKSISTLQKTDSLDKMKAIRNQIKQFENLDPDEFTMDIIERF